MPLARTEVRIVHVRIEAHRTERHMHHWQVVDSIVRYLRYSKLMSLSLEGTGFRSNSLYR
jgi:hypothetical protein